MSGFSDEKMYTFIKGFAIGANLKETLISLSFAREKHKSQMRKSGQPYIIHPLTMASHAISIGITDDNTLAMILLHDTVEDCGISLADLPNSEIVKKGVSLLTFSIMEGETKEIAKRRYYNSLLDMKEVVLSKLLDRCHNVSSMAGTFSEEKLKEYIVETREYVLPLIKKSKEKYPELTNTLFALKYHINSVIDSIENTLKSNHTA